MNKKTIILGSVFAVLVFILIFFVLKKEEKPNTVIEKKQYNIVSDYSEFFTMVNCANKYYSYLSLGDIDNLSKLLDGRSEEEERIKLYKGKNISYKVKEMYYGNNRYYLKGIVNEELIKSIKELNEEYLIINVDSNRKLFNIEVIDKKIYEEAINGK